MSARHAAALTLAGWLMLSPPVMRIPRLGSRVNHVAHLKYWKVRGSYESAGDCDDAKGAMVMAAEANPAKMPESFIDLSPTVVVEVTDSLICVPSDDPRLK
jgi:hypothetical protein